jgi:hypothetical protein
VSFGDNLVSRKSIKGYLFILFGGLINWRLIKQKLVIKSSTKAELIALLHVITKSI